MHPEQTDSRKGLGKYMIHTSLLPSPTMVVLSLLTSILAAVPSTSSPTCAAHPSPDSQQLPCCASLRQHHSAQ